MNGDLVEACRESRVHPSPIPPMKPKIFVSPPNQKKKKIRRSSNYIPPLGVSVCCWVNRNVCVGFWDCICLTHLHQLQKMATIFSLNLNSQPNKCLKRCHSRFQILFQASAFGIFFDLIGSFSVPYQGTQGWHKKPAFRSTTWVKETVKLRCISWWNAEVNIGIPWPFAFHQQFFGILDISPTKIWNLIRWRMVKIIALLILRCVPPSKHIGLFCMKKNWRKHLCKTSCCDGCSLDAFVLDDLLPGSVGTNPLLFGPDNCGFFHRPRSMKPFNKADQKKRVNKLYRGGGPVARKDRDTLERLNS